METRSETSQWTPRRAGRAVVAALAAALAAAVAVAVPGTAAAQPDEQPLSTAEVEAFVDEFMQERLEEYDIPGAAVSVVSGGEQVFAGGYGQADIDAGEPVDAESTTFFIGSVPKLITATAVMQQVEAGNLDLDADVNDYLESFEIEDTYPGDPITLRHLLTHTSGFDALVWGTGASTPDEVEPLDEFLAEHQPERIRPPGEASSYDNYALSLAGHLVEIAAGMPFDAYIEEEILAPLGMSMTSMAQPAPAPVTDALARGYAPDGDGGQTEVTGQYGHDAPAGAGTISSVVDMSRFMLAHLGGGEADGVRILSEQGTDLMHARQFGNDERLPGMGLSFFEQFHGDHRLIEHGGDSPGFHTLLSLLPDQDVGLFVAVNGDGTGDLTYELRTEFIDRFFPSQATPLPDHDNAEAYGGSYRMARVTQSDATKLLALIATASVSDNDDGTIDVDGVRYRPVGPDLFQSEDDGDLLAFRRDASGEVSHLFFGAEPAESFVRLSWYQSPATHLVAAGVALLIVLSMSWWPISALWRRLRGGSGKPGSRLGSAVAGIAGASALGGVIGLGAVAMNSTALLDAVLLGGSAALSGVFALFSLAALAGLGTVVCAVAAWRRGWWGPARRWHYTAVALALTVFLVVAGYYHLVGWPLIG